MQSATSAAAAQAAPAPQTSFLDCRVTALADRNATRGLPCTLRDFVMSTRHAQRIEALRRLKSEGERRQAVNALPHCCVAGWWPDGIARDRRFEPSGLMAVSFTWADNFGNPGFDHAGEVLSALPYALHVSRAADGRGWRMILRLADQSSWTNSLCHLHDEMKAVNLVPSRLSSDIMSSIEITCDPHAYNNLRALPYGPHSDWTECLRRSARPTEAQRRNVLAMVDAIERTATDITEGWHRWWETAIALSRMGPEGEVLFIRVSAFNPAFDPVMCHLVYEQARRIDRPDVTVSDFLRRCARHGLRAIEN